MKPGPLQQDEYCEPCGECAWCHRRHETAAALTACRAETRKLRALVEELAHAVQQEIDAAQEPDHPSYQHRQQLVARARRALGEKKKP